MARLAGMMQISQIGSERASSPQHVVVPMRYDGIGNALRSSFSPRTGDLPREIVELLDKLR